MERWRRRELVLPHFFSSAKGKSKRRGHPPSGTLKRRFGGNVERRLLDTRCEAGLVERCMATVAERVVPSLVVSRHSVIDLVEFVKSDIV